jgi:superfamily II DNA helicase RecQ
MPALLPLNSRQADSDVERNMLRKGLLRALMQSHTVKSTSRGIPAAAVNRTFKVSTLSFHSICVFLNITQNAGIAIYCTLFARPKMAQTSALLSHVLSDSSLTGHLLLVVIGDVYCISEWEALEFRGEYTELSTAQHNCHPVSPPSLCQLLCLSEYASTL